MATAHVRIKANELEFQLKAREAAVREEVQAANLDAAKATERRVVKKSPVDQGFYKASWKIRTKIVGRFFVRMLVNDAPYAGVIEGGARPFMPPFDPIFEWAQRKAGELALAGVVKINPGAFRVSKAGKIKFKGRASLDDDDLDALRQFVHAWRMKVSREGMKPNWIMKRELPWATKMMKKLVERRLGDILGKKF